MLLGGLDGLTADIFVTSAGHVYHLNVFVSSLASALSAYISAAFVATVAFFFSTVVGKTALALLFAYLTTMLSGIVNSAIETLPYFGVSYKVVNAIETVLSFTFIPYAGFDSYFVSANQLFSLDIFSMAGFSGLPANRLVTTVVIILWTTLFVLLSALCFKKKDIKS
jgi:ABC-type transport system involved in multi-copper enzyme maturation permease subunit